MVTLPKKEAPMVLEENMLLAGGELVVVVVVVVVVENILVVWLEVAVCGAKEQRKVGGRRGLCTPRSPQ